MRAPDCFCFCFGLPLAAADDPPGPVGKATVAFEMLRTNHMVVHARINGQGPFDLIFDLVVPITLLSTRAGAKSGVIAAGARARPRSIGSRSATSRPGTCR